MLGPTVAAGMEQGDTDQGVRIRHENPIGFAQVAARTGPGQVVQLCKAALRSGKDVFDVKGGALKCLVHPAIFATAPRTHLDPPDGFRPGTQDGFRPKSWSPWARNSESAS